MEQPQIVLPTVNVYTTGNLTQHIQPTRIPPDMGVVRTASESILEETVLPSEEANYSVQGHAGKFFSSLVSTCTRHGTVKRN